MSKITNVFIMLSLLNNNRKYSLKELSELIEVSPRMIRIYKDELEKAGIYIDSIRGPYGGYILNEKLLLLHCGFSKYDIELLVNIKKVLANNPSFAFKKELEFLIGKIKGVYKGNYKPRKGKLLSVSNKEKYNIFSKAIKERRKVLISFLQLNGEVIDRIIHPYGFFKYQSFWIVLAFCEIKGEVRQFNLEKIIEYQLLNEV